MTSHLIPEEDWVFVMPDMSIMEGVTNLDDRSVFAAWLAELKILNEARHAFWSAFYENPYAHREFLDSLSADQRDIVFGWIQYSF